MAEMTGHFTQFTISLGVGDRFFPHEVDNSWVPVHCLGQNHITVLCSTQTIYILMTLILNLVTSPFAHEYIIYIYTD